MVFLGHGHDEFEMDVETEFEHGLGGVNHRRGQRLAWRKVPYHCGLVRVRGQRYGWGGVVMGLRMYSFIDVMINCLNYVHSVAPSGVAFNPSWHLTAFGAGRSAVAVHVASRRWLSFLR